MKSMNNKILLCLPLICALLACSRGESSSAPAGASSNAAGKGSPTAANSRIIGNEDLTPGLKGIDADNNGIRDDIDRLIAQKYAATPAMKKAAEQNARALQQNMEATTRKEAIAAGDAISRASDCAFKVFPYSTSQDRKLLLQFLQEIEALTANTKERFTAYWKAAALSSGAVFSQPDEPVCD